MITPDEIRRLAENKYRAFLKAVIAEESLFPLRVRFGRPKNTDPFPELHQAVQALLDGSKERRGHGYTVVCENIKTRKYGLQPLPVDVFFASEADYVAFLGKKGEVERLRANLAVTRNVCRRLTNAWLTTNLSRLLTYEHEWPDIMHVCAWFEANPRPECYCREIPVRVHTKFIEEHESVIWAALDLLLPNDLEPKADNFYSRFHLLDTKPLVRVKLLDSTLKQTVGIDLDYFAVPLGKFEQLAFNRTISVVIIENEPTFLTLPEIPNTVAVWGQGNAAALITTAPWVQSARRVVYWGDIDSAGLSILARLRVKMPAVTSILMDEDTLALVPAAIVADSSREEQIPQDVLTENEWKCWRVVKQRKIRLEQERIPKTHAHAVLIHAITHA